MGVSGRRSIERAGISRTSQDRDLQVASVQLILDMVATKTVGGGLDFRVPFIEKARESS